MNALLALASMTILLAGALLAGAVGEAAARQRCGGLIEPRCLAGLSAGAEALRGDCGEQLSAYRACLAEAAAAGPAGGTGGGKGGGPGCGEGSAARLWASAEAAGDCLSYRGFREACPNTPEARFALSAMERLGCLEGEKAQAAGAEPAAVEDRPVERDCAACPEMAAIPGGVFRMGSPSGEPQRLGDEGPMREVRIAPFALSRAAITFAEWDACAADGGCGRYWPKDQGWGRGDRPVISVSWEDAQAYVAWLNAKVPGAPYRLPSEAEWEYAARAGSTGPFWWGGEISPEQANYDGTYRYRGGGGRGAYRQRTVPARSFEPNPFGLYQVHGNVWEWTADCWSDSHAGAPADGAARADGDCARAPLKGGSWRYSPARLRSAARQGVPRSRRSVDFGFRVARSPGK